MQFEDHLNSINKNWYKNTLRSLPVVAWLFEFPGTRVTERKQVFLCLSS